VPPLAQAQAHLGLRLGADGLRVHRPPLSLDGDARRGVAFVGQIDARRRNAARVLCSAVTARARGWVGAMTPPWGKPFQLGRLALALLPAGSAPGAACLRLHLDGQTVLDARLGRPDALPGCEAVDLREADVVVVDARYAAVQSATIAELSRFVTAAAATGGAIGFDDPYVAWSAKWLLAEQGVAVRPSPALQRAWRRLPAAEPSPRRTPQVAFVLAPKLAHGSETAELAALVQDPLTPLRGIAPVAEAPLALAPTALTPAAHAAAAHMPVLAMARQACGTAIDAMVARCGATQVFALDAAGATALAARLDRHGVQVTLLQRAQQLGLAGLEEER
jgi:hypothetical protein